MPTPTDPIYVASTAFTGLQFHENQAEADAYLAAHPEAVVIPASQVDPDIRAEGQEWLDNKVLAAYEPSPAGQPGLGEL